MARFAVGFPPFLSSVRFLTRLSALKRFYSSFAKTRLQAILLLLVLAGVHTAQCRDFFAVVDQNGNLIRSEPGKVSVTHISTGQFEVLFDAETDYCSYTANIGDPDNNLVYSPGLIFTGGGHLNSSNGVYVETMNLNGSFSDYPFHLSVNCTAKFAVVNADGTLSRAGFDVQSVSRPGAGLYEVTFGVPVDSCAYIATVGDPGDGSVSGPALVFTEASPTGPNSVSVETKSLNGNLADYPFHLSVVCTSSFAVVNGTSIVRGDAQTVTRLGQGRYEVTFLVPLAMCSYTASIGNPDSSTFANAGMIFTAGGHISQNHKVQ
jgi:hypothetical protein